MFTKPRRKIKRVFVHCTASDRDTTVGEIRRWHKARGWNDVGYHYLIRRGGLLQLGRPLTLTPAAQKGHNKHSIAIALNGLTWFSIEQVRTLINLCMEIDDVYGGDVSFHGHNEVANKACPVFNYREVLRLNPEGYMMRKET